MPWIPWFSRIDEDALEEAIQKTKSTRRTSKRATIPKKQEGSKEKPKAANKVDAQDVHAREERAQKRQALAQQVNEAYEKMRPRDTPKRETQKRDVRAPPEVHAEDMPVRQMSAGGSYERDLPDFGKRGPHGSDRRAGGPSPIPNPSNVAYDQEDNDDFDDQPRHILRSSRHPNRRNLPDIEVRDHHGINRRPGGEPSRTSDPYNNGADFEEEHDFGHQPQSGTRSSQGLDLSDDDDEGFEEQLLHLHRLDLLGSLDQPRPRERELREAETERDSGFTHRYDERPFHIPGSFATDDETEDGDFIDYQSHLGPGSSHRPISNYYGEEDPEAHLSDLRRLDSLRHSYSPPVDQHQRAANVTRPARETYNGEIHYRHVYAHELDGSEIKSPHVSNRRHSLDPYSHGVDYDDDDELTLRRHDGTRPSRRHSHHVAFHPPQNEQLFENQRVHTSRRPVADSQPVEAHPRTHSQPFQQEEPIRGGRHSDVLNPSCDQRVSPGQRPDNPRRSASKSQSTRANYRPYQEPSYQEESSYRRHHDEPITRHNQSVNQSRRPSNSEHPTPTSRSTKADPRPPSRAPHHEGHSHGRRHSDVLNPSYGRSTSQNQRPDNTRRSASVSQPRGAQSRPSSRAPHQEEHSRRSHHNRPHSSSSQSVIQTRRPNESGYPAPTSRSTTANPKSSSTAPRQKEPPRQRPRHASVSQISHSTTQTHQQNSSRYPAPRSQPLTTHPKPPSTLPRRWEPPSIPKRTPSTQRTETSRRSSSGPHLLQKTLLPRLIPRQD